MVALASGDCWRLTFCQTILTLVVTIARSEEIFLEWHVAIDLTLKPMSVDQPVITINGMFPGPLINSTTNDNVHVNVFNDMDEPLLMTWSLQKPTNHDLQKEQKTEYAGADTEQNSELLKRTILINKQVKERGELILKIGRSTPLVMPKSDTTTSPNLDLAVIQEELERMRTMESYTSDILPYPRELVGGLHRRMTTLNLNFILAANNLPP
ncbi:hypothetical protein HYC85_013984 [Camellia sinensis]|uniref:Plastocyanin-like domain-containing protein n=1 Tax=Camellia sinensis TaxID=4442 RepID=A0A7J7H645_CAMSI|nr:hypothetical protein HYC85_013984 [Camellia sinensis]